MGMIFNALCIYLAASVFALHHARRATSKIKTEKWRKNIKKTAAAASKRDKWTLFEAGRIRFQTKYAQNIRENHATFGETVVFSLNIHDSSFQQLGFGFCPSRSHSATLISFLSIFADCSHSKYRKTQNREKRINATFWCTWMIFDVILNHFEKLYKNNDDKCAEAW